MERVRVVAGEFEDLVTLGLRAVAQDAPNLHLVADRVPLEELDAAIEQHAPHVALIGLSALRTPITVRELHERHRSTRLVVLAGRPTAAECNQLLALGATACISKETEARDIVNAIHLASRGMHVMPRV